jgi:hypothetical protein
MANPAFPPALIPPELGALVAEGLAEADATEPAVVFALRAVLAASRGTELASVVLWVMAVGRPVEELGAALAVSATSELRSDDGAALEVLSSSLDTGAADDGATTGAELAADDLACGVATGVVEGLTGAVVGSAVTPTVVYPPIGPSKVGVAVT